MRLRTSTAAALGLLLAAAHAQAQAPAKADDPAAGSPSAQPSPAPGESPGKPSKAPSRKKKRAPKRRKKAAPRTSPVAPAAAAAREKPAEDGAAGPQDDVSPAIAHTPVGSAPRGKPFPISARVTDAGGVFEVLAHVRKHGGAADYVPLKMVATRTQPDDYTVEVPGKLAFVDLDYFIEAYDNAGNRATAGMPDRPLVIRTSDEARAVVEAIPRGAPSITHAAVARAVRAQPLELAARIVGENGVSRAAVFYRRAGETSYRSLPMGDLGEGAYTATLPASLVSSDLEYYLEAFDKDGNGPGRSAGPAAPYRVTVGDAAAPAAMLPQMVKAPFSANPGRAAGWLFIAGFVGAGLFAGGEAYGAAQANHLYHHTFDYEGRLLPELNDRSNQYSDRARKFAIASGASLVIGIALLIAFPSHPDRVLATPDGGMGVRF